METTRIKTLTDNILHNMHNIEDLGLYMGKMGICIYLFILARHVKEKVYEENAENLLDDICSQKEFYNISLEAGLPGIVSGLRYLEMKRYRYPSVCYL